MQQPYANVLLYLPDDEDESPVYLQWVQKVSDTKENIYLIKKYQI